jgi:hypothetical protein
MNDHFVEIMLFKKRLFIRPLCIPVRNQLKSSSITIIGPQKTEPYLERKLYSVDIWVFAPTGSIKPTYYLYKRSIPKRSKRHFSKLSSKFLSFNHTSSLINSSV